MSDLIAQTGKLPQSQIEETAQGHASADLTTKIKTWYENENPFSLLLYGLGILIILYAVKSAINSSKSTKALASGFDSHLSSLINRKTMQKTMLESQIQGGGLDSTQRDRVKGQIKDLDMDLREAEARRQ